MKIICFESPWPSTHLAREEIHPGAAGCSLQRQNYISKNKMATFMMYIYIYVMIKGIIITVDVLLMVQKSGDFKPPGMHKTM